MEGNSLDAARTAALELGKLTAGGMLAYHKADEFWKRRFAVRLVDEKWWSTVHEAFQSGRSSLLTMNDLLEQHFPVAADDDDFFEPTVFEWEDPATKIDDQEALQHRKKQVFLQSLVLVGRAIWSFFSRNASAFSEWCISPVCRASFGAGDAAKMRTRVA